MNRNRNVDKRRKKGIDKMPTIKDVAKHAEVSIATVSRIINNKGPISEKTRKKVYESMKELNYLPNEMARALQKKKSNGVLLTPLPFSISSPTFVW